MLLSIITPSIRPRGLEVVFDSLASQTFRDFEWLPRLSLPIPGKPDLCYQMNQALKEAKGDFILSWQDYISLPPDGLERIAKRAKQGEAWTFPVIKDRTDGDWRALKEVREIEFHMMELDLGIVPRETFLDVGGFDEEGDRLKAIGGEDKILASKLHWRHNFKFFVDPTIRASAFDHDAAFPHPHKGPHQEPLMSHMRAMMLQEQIRAIDKIPRE